MELKYIVMTIIKILISIPSILLLNHQGVDGASLMGGYLDNNQNFTSINISDSSVLNTFQQNSTQSEEKPKPIKQNNLNSDINEKMPDPSALVLPGYNLPENIFNKGKPFYLEKDPLTGKVDFNAQTFLENEEEYEYIDEVPNTNIYDKANIDRKDGNVGKYSHKANDVNQLTPNFHDFLNLPVKYNPEKYVYPLISNSYANTKVQGNTNKYNHKNYGAVYKPTANPTYNSGEKSFESEINRGASQVTITTTQPTTTTQKLYITTKPPNLMHGLQNYANVPPKHKQNEIYLTTQNVNDIYLTTKAYSTTTKRPLSLFEQLFGEYEDMTTTDPPKNVPSLFQNLPTNKNKNDKVDEHYNAGVTNTHNILTGSDLNQENMYVYEDYESVPEETDNNSILQPQSKFEVKQTSTSSPPTTSTTTTTTPTRTTTTTARTTSTTPVITTSVSTTTLSTTTTATPNYFDESSTDYDLALSDNSEYDLESAGNSFNAVPEQKVEVTTDLSKVTSLPIGDNHIGSQGLRPPIIAVTHNLKEQLNNEKVISPPYNHQPVQQLYSNQPVSQPYNHQPVIQPYTHQQVPSSNSIRISPNQDTVSFVVGQQQNVGTGYVSSSFQNQPYNHNLPSKPSDEQPNGHQKEAVNYSAHTNHELDSQSFIHSFADMYKPYPKVPDMGGSSLSIQPIKTSEASLSIGVPLDNDKKIPGHVVDEKINDEIEFSNKGTGNKIIFPTEKISSSTFSPPGLVPPPPRQPIHPNREVLQLDSKPMYHQLPSDLTPPNEKELASTYERPRPPWDPRPGHFYNGRPEYSRPPRPQTKPNGEVYKRVDNLPNILPQFRPNVKSSNPPPHYYDHMGSFKNGFMRQPLLERPSNRPIAYFEKLIPPPPPKNLHNLRKVPIIDNKLKHRNAIEDNSKNEQYEFYSPPHPPQVLLANRRKSDEPTIETLQMLQAKHVDTKDVTSKISSSVFKSTPNVKENTEKPLYVVYPVNTAPIKLDVIDTGKKETVVVGTRAELPLPPSKINEFSYESIIDRNDAPILKPHPKPSNLPVKSNFPYPLERPDITTLHTGNSLDSIEEHKFPFNNQWNAYDDTESRILTGSKINYKNANQISVTLKTYTDKPIAVAYTPTEPYKKPENTEKYSMPNYASPVVSEIRPGFVDKSGSEITLSAVMHTHPQIEQNPQATIENVKHPYLENHKIVDDDEQNSPPKLGFQAPFQASVNIDGISQGWTVVKSDEKSNIDRSDKDVVETTTQSLLSTTKFDINNFKPQMLSGFKPIYSYSTEEDSAKVSVK